MGVDIPRDDRARVSQELRDIADLFHAADVAKSCGPRDGFMAQREREYEAEATERLGSLIAGLGRVE